MKEIFEPYHTGNAVWINDDDEQNDYNLSLPPWICQPYIRRAPEKHIEYIAQKQKEAAEREKVDYFNEDGQQISKNVMKRLKKVTNRQQANATKRKNGHNFELCSAIKCSNPTVRKKICIILIIN